MKPQRGFVAERALAQHSAALLRPGPGATELIGGLERVGQRIAKALPGALAPLIGDVRLEIPRATPQKTTFGDYELASAPLAANCLLGAGVSSAPFLVVIDAAAVFALVDRAFGGAGLPPETLPRAFPLAAELAIERLEALLGGAIASALGGQAEAIRPLRRDGELAQLAPFAGDTPLAVMSLKIEEATRATWTIDLAFPLTTLEMLFGANANGGDQPAPRPRSAPRAPDPQAEPFASMPLLLSAVLVDMALPLSALSQLELGQVLPVSVARRVPLRIGDVTVAHGSVGASDERVAIQILS
ncbi:FliM/FliN family flagellar motor switch protein [Novosphingobium sp.]|uniref:FliM/FliN family flagellar motor switch protein n=1 Tax=Novosphingobium sp. TaxID=1874826 RepID=UPI0025CF2D86|nr:FliM/FliN family flagellar motor switch protein [Novosphingobium sp.]